MIVIRHHVALRYLHIPQHLSLHRYEALQVKVISHHVPRSLLTNDARFDVRPEAEAIRRSLIGAEVVPRPDNGEASPRKAKVQTDLDMPTLFGIMYQCIFLPASYSSLPSAEL